MKKNTENQDIEKKIIEVIDKIRPFLISDGGNIEFVKYEDGIAYVKMLGHCADCPMIDMTLKDGVEIAITSEIPEVVEVRNVE
mgnify:CR=1 FL=1